MPLVRALALHVGEGWKDVGDLVRSGEALLDCARSVGVDAWTLRLILPPTPYGVDCGRLVGEVSSSLGDKFFLHLLSLDHRHPCLRRLVELVSLHERVYASVLCTSLDCVVDVLGMLWRQDADPLVYTRIAILVGDWVATPYFPATTSTGPGVSVALRYVDLASRALEEGVGVVAEYVRRVEARVAGLAGCLGTSYLGIDLSLSPWMEESVAGLAEKAIGARLEGANGIYAARVLVDLVERVRAESGVKTTGFNEPMFAVAEDNLLDKRVEEGSVRLRDLIAYSTVCVAGVDMVAVPRGMVQPLVLGQAVWGVYLVKKRPFGVRVIPVDGEPGEKISLGRFGKTTIAYP